MKRSQIKITFIFYLLVPLFAWGEITPKVKPYEIEPELSNVSNLTKFKKAIGYRTRREFTLSKIQKEKLVQNGFVVVPHDAEQFFHIYESSHFGMAPRIPNFITSDCILQLYHLFYDFTLRAIEVEELLPALYKLTEAMMWGSRMQYYLTTDPTLKLACLKNTSFFLIAAKLLGIDISFGRNFPSACSTEVEADLQKIEKHEGRESSAIFPWLHDYSQYLPRGHYTRSEDLKRFFLCMMWYGQNSFPFEFEGKRTEQQILQALLITHLLFNRKVGREYGADVELAIQLWDEIYSITSSYVGSTNDLNPHHSYKLMKEVYGGEEITLEDLADKENLNLFYEKAENFPKPKIVPQLVGIPSGLQFRFMGQRYIPDSYIMQELVNWPGRPWPKGLDVMAVLNSTRAASLLDNLYKESEKWSEYLPRRERLKEEFTNLSEEEWHQNLYFGWLYALKSLIKERSKGYPTFMQNVAWTDKQLNTALASWAELRHDAILYAMPSAAEGGDGREEILQSKGYVEPVPEFYNRLMKLLTLHQELLLEKWYVPKEINRIFRKYKNLLSFLERVADKELTEVPLTYKEYERIRYFGHEIENLSLRIVELGRNLPTLSTYEEGKIVEKKERGPPLRGWFEVTGPDRDIACIADVHTSERNCLEEAVGHVNLIYVIAPVEGKLHLTRGGVFSYYEFQYPTAHKLNDEAWQEMIKRGKAPEVPSWTSSFIAE